MASEEFCPKRILERELLAGKDTTKANEKFSPKCILENEFLAGMDTNGTSLDDLWKDAPLWKKQWCVWSASQAVLFEVTGQLLEERGEEGIAPLLQNPSFTDEVFPGKYETCIMEPPTTLTRERVRSTCSLNETKEILLHNRLLRRDIDPLMPRAQQVEALLQLEGGTEFRVSTSCSNEDNSDDTAGIKDTASAGIEAPIERYPNTALPTAATATTTAAATFFATTTTASAAAVTSTSITAPAATPTTASAAAVTSTSITATAATPSTAAVRPPVTAFTPSSAVAAATAIDAVAEGNTDDAFAIAAAAGIAYDAVKKEDVVPSSISATAYAAATNAFDTASASADLFDESAASACTGCAAVYDFYFRYTGEEEETHPSLYNNNNMSSSSFYNNNNNNNKPSSSLYNNKNKPSSSLYNNNYKPSSFYNNINDPRLVGFLANKMESKKRKRDDLKVDGFYLKRLRYDNKPSCSLYYNNTKPSSSLYNNNNDPRLFGFSAHKMELKKRKRNKLQDDGFYLKRLRYD